MAMLAIIRFIGFLKVSVLKTIIAIRELGSISAVSGVRSLILPIWGGGGGVSAGSFSRSAAGNQAYERISNQRNNKYQTNGNCRTSFSAIGFIRP